MEETKLEETKENLVEENKEEIHENIKKKEQVTQDIKAIGKANEDLANVDLLQRIKESIDSRKDEPWRVRNKCPSMVKLNDDDKLFPVCSLFTENQKDVPQQDWHMLTIPFQLNGKVEQQQTLCCSKTMQILSNVRSQAIWNKDQGIVYMLILPIEEGTKEFWRNIFAQFLQLGALSYEDARKYATKTKAKEEKDLPFDSLDTSLSKLSIKESSHTAGETRENNGLKSED